MTPARGLNRACDRIGVVVEASAQRDVHARGDLLRGLQVRAGLVRPEARVEKERVDAGHRRIRRVVAVGRFHRVVDAERLEAATGLHRVEERHVHGEVVLDGGLALARILGVDHGAPRDDDLGRHAWRRHALRHQVFHLLAHLGLGVGDAQQAHAARPEGALPVEARGAAPAVVADVEVGNLVFEVGGFAEAQPNLVDARDVDQPDAVPGREVVHGLGVERIHHRHAAEAHVLGEQIQEASSRRHHPRIPFSRVDGPFENGAGAGEAERGPPAELLAIALALGHLQHARRAVDVGRGVAAGEERHVLQQLGIEQADRAAGRREIREGVDVGNLDVVHHEQVLERAAAADDDVVAEVVACRSPRPAGPARSATRPAGPRRS